MDRAAQVHMLESAVKSLAQADADIRVVFGTSEVADEYRTAIDQLVDNLRSDIDTIRALYGA
jgi:hypothetical protein